METENSTSVVHNWSSSATAMGSGDAHVESAGFEDMMSATLGVEDGDDEAKTVSGNEARGEEGALEEEEDQRANVSVVTGALVFVLGFMLAWLAGCAKEM